MSDIKKYPWNKFPDFIVHHFSTLALKRKTDYAYGVGPGLGLGASQVRIIKYLIKNKFPKVVLDADALTIISKMNNIDLPDSWILTPHEGEALRLLGLKNKIDRMSLATKLSQKYGCHILLKGHETILISNKKEIVVMNEGVPALAKAGTGDVLTGIITALLAQGLSPFEAMKAGGFIHARSARQYLSEGHDEISLRPTDLIERLSKVIKKLKGSK